MIKFFNVFAGVGGFRAKFKRLRNAATINVAHIPGLRPKSAHKAAVAATGAEWEAADG